MQRLISRLFGKVMKAWGWIVLILAALLIKFASTQPLWVEENYSINIYPVISKIQRAVFGWIPISIGDLVYAFLILIVIFKTIQLIKVIFKRQFTRGYFLVGLRQLIFFFLFVYVLFYSLWGLNYSRNGITYQLNLGIKKYSIQEIDTLTNLLQQKLNFYASKVNIAERDSFDKKRILFENASQAYLYANNIYPFLNYGPQSIKPSVFSYIGNYLGFQGYYNPLTGEAQVNTTVPHFMEPYVSAHEVAHQLGYAKENEANFVAFLACRSFPNNVYRYSMYFDLYNYTIHELGRRDSALANTYIGKLHPQVKKDIEEYLGFFKKYKNPVEPLIAWAYGGFLQANNQPEGKRTYNQVVAFLIAYYKKFGKEAI